MADDPLSLARWFHAATSYPPSFRAPGITAGQASSGVVLPLPRPRALDRPLGVAIAGRASCRRFATAPLSLADVSTLLDGAYGTRGEADVAGFRFPVRPVPSAGATYPLGLCLAVWAVTGVTPGIHRYLPDPHALERGPGDLSPEFACDLFLGQRHLLSAGALVVVTAGLDAPLVRYGDRGYRYVLLEAGHLAQNLNLTSNALGLASLDLGGFLDRELSVALGLSEEVPLYGVALGHPAVPDCGRMREPTQ